jgi:hypothetical protein
MQRRHQRAEEVVATTTQLTPNSQCVATITSTSASVAFQIQPQDTAYWTPTVTTTFTSVSNPTAKGNAVVQFDVNLSVTLNPQQGGGFVVLVAGPITDSGSTYNLTGQPVGTYTPST